MSATTVLITTDLTISGKAAQFGRGVLADVSTNLIGQFAKSLEAERARRIATSDSAAGAPPAETSSAAAAQDNAIEPLDLVKAWSRCRSPSVTAPLVAGDRRGRGDRIPAGPPQAQVSPAAAVADDLQAALLRLLS